VLFYNDDCVLSLIVCVIIWCDKEAVPEEDPVEQNDHVMGVENVSEDEGKSHRPFDHIDPMNDCL
jgi:hypothetical protein